MWTKYKISNWTDQQHCIKVTGATWSNHLSTRWHHCILLFLQGAPLKKIPLIYQVTPLHILFLQAYTCRSHAPVLFPLPPPPGDVGTLLAIYGKMRLIYTQHAPYPWDFTLSLHPHICFGWGFLQWLCQLFYMAL